MTTASTHYDTVLAELYSWMLGDLDVRVREQGLWLRGVVDVPDASAAARPRALDLGAGVGADAIALACLGYDVVAVDASAKLCVEGAERIAQAGLADRVAVVESDLIAFLESSGTASASLAVCLGDTLTHLESPQLVQRMFRAARACIAPGGRFVLTYRDLSRERTGSERFFLVRADHSRILTCVVEYETDRVIVNDIVHTRTERGWEMATGAYPKLRLATDRVRTLLFEAGFAEVTQVACAGGLVALVAR